jgi:hypothetical protein
MVQVFQVGVISVQYPNLVFWMLPIWQSEEIYLEPVLSGRLTSLTLNSMMTQFIYFQSDNSHKLQHVRWSKKSV